MGYHRLAGAPRPGQNPPDDAEVRHAWTGVPGLGWVTWQYFCSLAGIDHFKPDVMLEDIVRREAKRDLRAAIRERDGRSGQPDWQEQIEEDDRAAERRKGARHVTFRGRRVFMTAGQMARITSSLDDRPPGQRLALF